jgi:hypothetical protein
VPKASGSCKHFSFDDLVVATQRGVRKSRPASGIFRLRFGIARGEEL